jgi:acetyltransferase
MADIASMFDPKCVAVIGGSDKEGSIGKAIVENLLVSRRRVFPVNTRRKTLLEIPTCPDIASVPEKVDLAIVATPSATVPSVIEECGAAGVKAAIIVSSGFREIGPEGEQLESRIVELRNRYTMRIMGPSCLGFIRPHMGFNATPLPVKPLAGNIAFISQSGGFGRALLEWGIDTHIGFSMFASLGSMIDVDLGDLIDFLGYDPHTKSIMVYMEESIGDVKKFISAARGFARNKPIVVLKPARMTTTAHRWRTHAGRMATSDHVYDAVFKRVGVVRVKTAGNLFNAAGVLYSKHLPKGPRLLVVTNAAGIGVMAVNTLHELGGRIGRLSKESIERLRPLLPPTAKEGMVLDLFRDADVARYVDVLKVCLEDAGVDGILVIFTPQGTSRADELAQAVAGVADSAWKPIVTTWMGGKETQEARRIFFQNNIPTYDTPEEAVQTYLYMYNYGRNLEILYETPGDVPLDEAPPKNSLKTAVRKALSAGRTVLTDEESMKFLANYRIPTAKTATVRDVDQAVTAAHSVGFPVVLKIASEDIVDRSDMGGVEAGIASEEELREAYAKLLGRAEAYRPESRVTGMTLQKMVDRIDYEIILGAKKDEDFGTVILFGMGGIGVELFRDFSVGLPPLNQSLARKLMEETKVYRLLQGYRGKQPADLEKLEHILLSFSNLIIDFPEIAEIDINPIAFSNGRAMALDARIVLDPDAVDGAGAHPHLIISPYPSKYVMHWKLTDGTDVLLRPIRPEDEPLEHEMLTTLSKESLRERFFQPIRRFTHEMHTRLCNIDYEREMAIVAEIKEGNRRTIIGMVRLIMEPELKRGEFAVVVHDRFQGKGLGYKLVDTIIGVGHEKGLEECYGFVLSDNRKMLNMCMKLGFQIEPVPDGVTKVVLRLT